MTIHPNRGAVPIDTWLGFTQQASESIDLLAYAASFLHDAVPDFVNQLAERARAGVQVRLLFGDSGSDAVALRGREEGIEDMLQARCRLTWNYFGPVLGSHGVLARMHGTTLYNSLFRFDDTLLVNAHIYGAAASHSPVLHVQWLPGGRLFSNYMLGFERTWDGARPVDR